MEYNTQREKMQFSDYGRNVYKLIQYAKTIENRELRTHAAEVIVGVMAQVSPHARETVDYKRKLWDHLMILSNWELDVDCPYELTRGESIVFHPKSIPYQNKHIRYRHYGRWLESMINRVAEFEDGEEKELLTALIVNQMKKSYISWNRAVPDSRWLDTTDDDIIERQLEDLSNGRLKKGSLQLAIDPNTVLTPDQLRARQPKSKKRRNPNNNNNNSNNNNNNGQYRKKRK